MTRITFVMEIGLGHTTYYKNLRSVVEQRQDIDPTWVEITFEKRGILAHLPKVRNDITLRAGLDARKKVENSLRSTPADALFFHTQLPAVLCHHIMQRVPSAIDIDATPKQFLANGKHYGLASDDTSFVARRNNRWYQRAFQSSHMVTSWSQWAADSVVADYGISASNVCVVHPGVDLEKWSVRTPREDKTIRLLFVGGDFLRKGGDFLVRWMNECAPSNCHLDIVTRDPVASAPNITIHHGLNANDPALIALYQSADLFLLPTRADFWPNALVEAMASGIALLSTAITSIPELIATPMGSESPGVLVPPENWAAFAQALTVLCQDKQRLIRMGKTGRQMAEQHFDARTNFSALIDTLKSIAIKPSL